MRPAYKISLDADTQTDGFPTQTQIVTESSSSDLVGINQQLVGMQMSLISRINELEIQNAEIHGSLLDLSKQVTEFIQKWEHRTNQEKDSDLLMRNVGLLS